MAERILNYLSVVFAIFKRDLLRIVRNPVALVLIIGACVLPIQLSAQIFQDIYPWLSFTHSVNLFQGAIAGVYENQYLISMACLLAFVIPALILGLALHRPIDKLNDFIDEQLERTGVL